MKKYLALALGVIFTLGFAASAFAIMAEIPEGTQAVVAAGTRITLNGIWMMSGKYLHAADLNQSTALENANDNATDYGGYVSVLLLADISKDTQGFLSFVTVRPNWIVGDTYATNPPGVLAVGNSRKGPVMLGQAWIQHKSDMLGFPAGIKIGHMPLSVGNGVFFKHTPYGDDAIVLFFDPTKEVHAVLSTAKLSEGGIAGSTLGAGTGTINPTVNDDADVYAASLAYKGKDFNLSGDYTVVNDQMRGIDTNGALVTNLTSGDHGMRLNNLGLRGDATFGNLNVSADVELQSGKTAYENSSIKHKGRAYVLGASYTLSPATALSLNYVYGSGDDNSADNDNNVFVTSVSGGEGTAAMTYVYDSSVVTATGLKKTTIANTAYIKAGVAHNLTKDLKATLSYFVLRASKLNSSAAINGLTTHLSKKIGSELDAQITYAINKNLMYVVEGGYLWTGKFYDSTTLAAGNVYSLMHRISLRF
ncbi:MAG: alginate export family protein [Thermodesulfovibrionales bacterium]|nr:alginate export family protein [Thermodesulfovibrionales bacterium]